MLQPLLPEVPLELSADSVRSGQVFVNPIQNAAKFTHEGGTIWIKATVEGDEAVVRVQDTGMGIAGFKSEGVDAITERVGDATAREIHRGGSPFVKG